MEFKTIDKLAVNSDPNAGEPEVYGGYSDKDFEFVLAALSALAGGAPDLILKDASKDGELRFAFQASCSCPDCRKYVRHYAPASGETLMRAFRNYVEQRAEYIRNHSSPTCAQKSSHSIH